MSEQKQRGGIRKNRRRSQNIPKWRQLKERVRFIRLSEGKRKNVDFIRMSSGVLLYGRVYLSYRIFQS